MTKGRDPAAMRRHAVMAVVLLVAPPLGAPAEELAHAGCAAAVGSVPREILERPVGLRPGVGNAHERITTTSKEAQAFYDQGLNYLHGYVWIEAVRSFRQALGHDAQLAMAHVGLSRAYSGLGAREESNQAMAAAQALASKASAWEQRRIALRAKQMKAIAGAKAEHADYKKAIDDALALDFTDAELWLIRGNAEEEGAGGRGQRGGAASTAFYRTALSVLPDHAAAHHYLTHSYEMIGQIDRALEHGEAYARLAPGIPHAHHMWGHDLRRVGSIDAAITAFKKAEALEKAYYAAEGIAPEYDWHHPHNLSLLATAYQHKGLMRLAEAKFREVIALRPLNSYVAFARKELALFLIERQRYEEALVASRVLGDKPVDSSDRAIAHALAGEALLALGRVEQARAELAAAQDDPDSVAEDVKRFIDILAGELMLRSPDQAAEGRRRLEDVARALRATPGADAWITALFRLEAIARAGRDAGDWELADFMARQMFEHDPTYAGSHLAMAIVAQHRGDLSAVRTLAAKAQRLWRGADRDLPELPVLEALHRPARVPLR